MTTPNSLNIFIGKGCFFFSAKNPCKFCGFQDTRKELKDKDHITKENIQRLIKTLNNHDHEINQIYFVGGTYPDFDYGFQKVIDIVKITKEVVPEHIDLIVTNFPPNDLSLIKKLKEAGATRISLAIESATEKHFNHFCPGKSKYYGHQNFQKALVYATKYFPKATYASIIQGLDLQQDLIDFMWKMHDKGIMPTMNIYYHSPYSELKSTKKRPSVEYLYNVAKNHQKIFAKSNIRLFSYGADRHCLDWEAYRQMI